MQDQRRRGKFKRLSLHDSIIANSLMIYIVGLVYIIMYTMAYQILPFTYGDEIYYIKAGIKYVKGAPIDQYNPEHPPLGKYIIGFSTVYLHNPHIASFIAGLISSFLIYIIILRVSKSELNSLLGTILALLEIPFLKIFRYALLDSIAMPFILAAFYMTIVNLRKPTYKLLIVEGILWGLAVACKWPSLYILIAALVIKFIASRRTNVKSGGRFFWQAHRHSLLLQYIVLLSSALATYAITFLRDFIESPWTFIKHNIFMLSYMYSMHLIILNTIVTALTMMFLKTTFWHILPNVYITLKMVHGFIISSTTKITPPHHKVEIDILPTFGALLMPAISLLLPYGVLIYRKLNLEKKTTFIAALLSLLPAFHGNIPWYYAYPVVFWSIFAASVLKIRYIAILVLADIIYYTITCLTGLTHPIVLKVG